MNGCRYGVGLFLLCLALAAAQSRSLPPSPFKSGLSVAKIYRAILRNKSKSPEAALANVPPSMFSHYVLMHTSDSLQDGSAENPRVLSSNPAGTVYLGFNGSPDQDHYHNLEFVEYIDGLVSLRSIQFDPMQIDEPKLVEPDFSNPKEKCMGCHGISHAKFVPIWQPFTGHVAGTADYWGAFRGYRSDSAASDPGFAKSEIKLKSFIERAPHDPRYGKLLNLERDFTLRGGETLSPGLHNSVFNYRIQRVNADRVARRLLQREDYESEKYNFMRATLGCAGARSPVDFYILASLEGMVGDDEEAIRANPFGAHFFNSEILSALLAYYDAGLRADFPIRWIRPRDFPRAFMQVAGYEKMLGITPPDVIDSLPAIPVLRELFVDKKFALTREKICAHVAASERQHLTPP